MMPGVTRAKMGVNAGLRKLRKSVHIKEKKGDEGLK